MLPIRTILHPTDFSAESHSAFEVASSLARDYKAKLLLLHVVPPPRVYAPDGIAVPFPVEEPANARANLDQLKPADATIAVEREVREGDAATEILKFAEEKQVDLIVMGTHGTSGLTRLLVGSVAESVLRKAPCPVLTVRGRFRVSPEGAATH
jgi:nucleotide-binding universal stress UspA family protein